MAEEGNVSDLLLLYDYGREVEERWMSILTRLKSTPAGLLLGVFFFFFNPWLVVGQDGLR